MNPTTHDYVADLVDLFPRQELRPRTVALYVEHLSDIPTSILGVAVNAIIRTSTFFPTVAEIREAAAEIALDLPSEDEALSQVERRVRERAEGSTSYVHPDVKRALDHVGGFFALRTTTEPSILRSQFLKIYRDIRAAQIRAKQISFAPALAEAS